MAAGPRARLTIDITDELNDRLQAIADDLGTTKSDIIKRSLKLMDFANTQRKAGKRVAISKDGETVEKEVVII